MGKAVGAMVEGWSTDGRFWKRLTVWLATAAVFSTLAVLFLRLVTHYPFFDESIHTRYSYLLSRNLKPGADFFCSHPVFHYLATLPVWRLFPETAFALLGFRFISLCLFACSGALLFARCGGFRRAGWLSLSYWALLALVPNTGSFLVEFSSDHLACLAAVGALLLFFEEPTPKALAISSGLSLFSVVVSPKYAFPLFFGLLGFIAALNAHGLRVRDSLLALAKGGGAALLLVVFVFLLNGVSLYDNILTVFFVTSRWSLSVENLPLWRALGDFFTARSPILGLFLLASLSGWIFTARERGWRDRVFLSGAGVLLGVALFVARVRVFYDQYQFPVIATLAVFAPFCLYWLRSDEARRFARPLVLFTVLGAALWALPGVASEVKGTSYDRYPDKGRPAAPFFVAISSCDEFLKVIPPSETVAATWPFHPLLRLDSTFMVVDDRPSVADLLPESSPFKAKYAPEFFARALEKRPPAMIALGGMNQNYPPGWLEVAQEYLGRNRGRFVEVPFPTINGASVFLRSDLAPTSHGIRER